MKSKISKKSKEKFELENLDKPIIDLNNSEIKALLKKGKSTGYITHDQLNKALPDGELTSEQIEDVMVAINELGINIIDQNEENISEENDEKVVGNISEDEGSRSDDPVRMYLKEMGTVELLSREGEIAIAKRIEAGKELMIGGLYENPIALNQFLQWRDNVDNGSMMLRDIIDLETTYARLNEDDVTNKNLSNDDYLNKNEILQSSKININILDKTQPKEVFKSKNEITADNDNEEEQDDNDDEDENDSNLSLVAMETEIKKNHRILVTTLTKKMAESLTEFMHEANLKVRYIHSDVETLERIEIIRDLRLGKFEVLIGINLLREGLDIPECALVAVLDADKEGYLRSKTSLIQTIGRAARNLEGKVILYADKITASMQYAIDETNRRRGKQILFNKKNNIEPKTIQNKISDILSDLNDDNKKEDKKLIKHVKSIPELEKEMREAASNLEFEEAAKLRDVINRLQQKEIGLLKK